MLLDQYDGARQLPRRNLIVEDFGNVLELCRPTARQDLPRSWSAPSWSRTPSKRRKLQFEQRGAR
jgi:hypothetical protein